jgi:hypothetical protein
MPRSTVSAASSSDVARRRLPRGPGRCSCRAERWVCRCRSRLGPGRRTDARGSAAGCRRRSVRGGRERPPPGRAIGSPDLGGRRGGGECGVVAHDRRLLVVVAKSGPGLDIGGAPRVGAGGQQEPRQGRAQRGPPGPTLTARAYAPHSRPVMARQTPVSSSAGVIVWRVRQRVDAAGTGTRVAWSDGRDRPHGAEVRRSAPCRD